MKDFYKVVDNGYITGIGTNGNDSADAITDAEYNHLLSLIRSAPAAPDGYTYRLRADNLEWEMVELPPAPEYEPTEADKAEAYDILIGGDAE